MICQNCFTWTFGDMRGLTLIDNGFSMAWAQELYLKDIHCVKDIWDNKHHTFISWDDAQSKFQLTQTDAEDWATLTFEILID